MPAYALNRPVSAGYVLRTVEVDLAALHAGAHSCGATVNDGLLWAWVRALHLRLAAVGLAGAPVIVSCMVTVSSDAIENRVGAIRIAVPVPGMRWPRTWRHSRAARDNARAESPVPLDG